MRVICTSKTEVPQDPTANGDVPARVMLTFAADTFGLDPAKGPIPTASISISDEAANAEGIQQGRTYVLSFAEAPVPGTAEGERVTDDTPPKSPEDGVTPEPGTAKTRK